MMISIFLETQCTSMTFTSCKKSVGIFTHFSRADATNRYRVFMNICCFFTKYSSEPRAANDSFYYNISYRVFHTKKILFQEKRKNYSVLSCDFAKCKTKHDNVASLQMAWGQQSYKKADRDG